MAAPLSVDTGTFTAYSDALQAAALATTRLAATTLPTDLSFHRSIDPTLAHDIDALSDRVLSLANKLICVASGNAGRLREEEDVVDDFVRNVVDSMEGMLEGTDGTLDVFLGRKRDPSISISTIPVNSHRNNPKKQPPRGRLDPALIHAYHLPKPQLLFKRTPSNTDESPYIPSTLIPHKWCAKVPLGYAFHDGTVSEDADDEDRRKRALHPYYYELTHPSYPDHVFNPPVEPSPPSPLEAPISRNTKSQPLTFISTPEAFLSMANTLSCATEIAVDLEHHSYRTYKGFLALMQISTRQDDFIVDLLVPEIREGLVQSKDKSIEGCEESRMANLAGQIVARVFADPSIIKVFHGAESDVVWLQQDFNIFIVGLFDTFHASKLLEFSKNSLAHLLETYCDFIADKRYQLADWRIRPLPTEMLTYARSDTHFLLYVYDMLRLSLIERSSVASGPGEHDAFTDARQTQHSQFLIHSVLTRSCRTALRLYEVEVYDVDGGTGPSGWDTLARKWNKTELVGPPSQIGGVVGTQESQAAVYKAVHQWRESVAQEEDESIRYVLPTHHLFLLAERTPTTTADLLSLFGGSGSGSIPPVLRRRAGGLVTTIKGVVEIMLSSNPQRSEDTTGEGTGIATSLVVETSEMTGSTVFSSSAVRLTDESRLWITPSSTLGTPISASHSSLFGITAKGHEQEEGITPPFSSIGRETFPATRSILFGSAISEATTISFSTTKSAFSVQTSDEKRFEDIVEKIHKTLVIAPVASMSQLTSSTRTQVLTTPHPSIQTNVEIDQGDPTAPKTPDSILPGPPEGQIEIPFIPAHKRRTLPSPPQNQLRDDTIVVVGQAGARQRKRKRDKAVASSQSKLGARLNADISIPTNDHHQDVEEFDYSSVPNLLDVEDRHEQAWGVREEDERKKKKQRHGKGSGPVEYGNFRVPRDQREVRGGNKTHTFR